MPTRGLEEESMDKPVETKTTPLTGVAAVLTALAPVLTALPAVITIFLGASFETTLLWGGLFFAGVAVAGWVRSGRNWIVSVGVGLSLLVIVLTLHTVPLIAPWSA